MPVNDADDDNASRLNSIKHTVRNLSKITFQFGDMLSFAKSTTRPCRYQLASKLMSGTFHCQCLSGRLCKRIDLSTSRPRVTSEPARKRSRKDRQEPQSVPARSRSLCGLCDSWRPLRETLAGKVISSQRLTVPAARTQAPWLRQERWVMPQWTQGPRTTGPALLHNRD